MKWLEDIQIWIDRKTSWIPFNYLSEKLEAIFSVDNFAKVIIPIGVIILIYFSYKLLIYLANLTSQLPTYLHSVGL